MRWEECRQGGRDDVLGERQKEGGRWEGEKELRWVGGGRDGRRWRYCGRWTDGRTGGRAGGLTDGRKRPTEDRMMTDVEGSCPQSKSVHTASV